MIDFELCGFGCYIQDLAKFILSGGYRQCTISIHSSQFTVVGLYFSNIKSLLPLNIGHSG